MVLSCCLNLVILVVLSGCRVSFVLSGCPSSKIPEFQYVSPNKILAEHLNCKLAQSLGFIEPAQAC